MESLLPHTSRLFSPLLALFLSTCTNPPSTHPVVSIFRFSVSPTSSLASLVSLSSECLSFVPQLSPINLVYRSQRLPIEILLLSPLLSPLCLCTPPFILYSWHHALFSHFHPHFPSHFPSPPPLLSSSITLAFPDCLCSSILPSFAHTSSLLLPS